MKYETFKTLVALLQACRNKMDKYYNVLKIDEVWDDFNKTITLLLEEIYDENAILYILDEWLNGDYSPVRYTQEDESIVEIPCKTIKQLWKIMEGYKRVDK